MLLNNQNVALSIFMIFDYCSTSYILFFPDNISTFTCYMNEFIIKFT